MRCLVHQDREGIATCVSCGAVVCPECRRETGGKNYCPKCEKTGQARIRSQAPPRKGPSCWVVGCFSGFILFLILLASSPFLWKWFVAPKVEQAKEEMKKQLGQVIQESAKDGGKKLLEKLKIPISMGEAKPSPDIPTYPKGEVAHSYRFGVKGNEANLVHIAIPDPPDRVALFYRENLSSRGWKLDQKSSKDGNETASFSKGKRYVYLVASPDSTGTSLLLVWTEGINPQEFLEKGK